MKFKIILLIIVLYLSATPLVFAQEPTANPSGESKTKTMLPDSKLPAQNLEGGFELGPEDIIEITVWENPELRTIMPVRPDGYISFPLIGDVVAGGKTLEQLRQDIAFKLKKYIKAANVAILVREINSIKIYVAGEVKEPGVFKLNRPITLLHIFSMVQGLKDTADLKNSYLLRDGKKINIDIHALVKRDDFSQNILLKANDFIFIHDNFSSRINIMGEVGVPQVLTYKDNMTILDAVLLADGLTDIAKPEETYIYRKMFNERGEQYTKRIRIDLERVIVKGDLTKNILLEPGDIIHIPRSFF
jgi:polysaccharide biosynthesis/export protein